MGEQQQAEQPLWVAVINKKTNEPYKSIWNCSSMPRLDKEEPELAKQLTKEFNEWLKVAGNDKVLKWDPDNRDGCGFRTTIGDYQYTILEFTKDGSSWRTLGRKKLGKGGYGGGKSYTLLRTLDMQMARPEQIAELLNNQGENDNYKITYMFMDDQGPMFQVERLGVYTPTAVTTSKGENKDGSEETEEASS